MKVIYIAGRFRGKTPWDVHCNIYLAEQFGLEVARMGGMPLIPHANTAHFDGQLDDQFWIEGTAELLRRCDAIALVPGNWAGSVGTKGEIQIARDRKMPIFCDLEADFQGVNALQTYGRIQDLPDLARFCRGS